MIEKLRLREGEYLKRAAMLLFHPEPGRFVRDAYVKIGYFRGAELLFQDVIEGDLFAQVDRTIDLLYSKYSRALVSYDERSRPVCFGSPGQSADDGRDGVLVDLAVAVGDGVDGQRAAVGVPARVQVATYVVGEHRLGVHAAEVHAPAGGHLVQHQL